MLFENLRYLWFLLLIPSIGFIYYYGWRVKEKLINEFACIEVHQHILLSVSKKKPKVKLLLILIAFFLMVIALTSPKWGYHWEELKRKGLDILIAIDVSKSMLTEDVKPNRLEVAKREIKSLISLMKGDRVGLVSFSGSSFLQCPLTLDYSTAKLFVDALNIESIPRGGTDIGGAILKAITAFEGHEKKHRVLFLITDGEDHEGRVMQVIDKAKEAGVIIFPIAIGRTEGGPIPIHDEKGRKIFVKDRNGNVVISKANQVLLQKIALWTDGRKAAIGAGQFPLEEIYKEEVSKMEKKEMESVSHKRFKNRFQLPLIIALLLLVVESTITERKEGIRLKRGKI